MRVKSLPAANPPKASSPLPPLQTEAAPDAGLPQCGQVEAMDDDSRLAARWTWSSDRPPALRAYWIRESLGRRP
jgi:hypothetical protein